MDGIAYYGEFIRNMDAICRQYIVCIRIRPDNPSNVSVGTGIVVASGDRTCFVITARGLVRNEGVVEVEFSDGTVQQIDRKKVRCQREASLILIKSDMKHWATVNFSKNEAVEGQRVFTYGYNSTPPTRRYISGNLVCGAGIANNDNIQFVHGCSTGVKGHLGSAVFNEANQLVGMNFFYTRSKGVDYCVDSKKHQQEQKENQQDQKEKSSPGGLVSAIDLHTIRHTLQLFLPKATGKNLQETLQYLQDVLKLSEAS